MALTIPKSLYETPCILIYFWPYLKKQVLFLSSLFYRILSIIQQRRLDMKNFVQVEQSDNSLSLVPVKSKNRKSIIKSEPPKDLHLYLPDTEIRQSQSKIFSLANMSIYHLKNTYKDKRKIKDAVTVKRMKLLCKENVENKKIPFLMNFPKRTSINCSSALEYARKTSEKLPLQIVSRKIYDLNSQSNETRTFTSPLSPKQIQNRNGFKLQRIEKQNQLYQSIFDTKPIVASTKSQALINAKLKSYLSFVKQGRKLHNFTQEIQKQNKKKCFRIKIKKGNNSQLIKWLFKKRWWWVIQEQKDLKGKPNFLWTQLKQKSFFSSDPSIQIQSQNQSGNQAYCHNHFQQNEYLGNKKALFYNMRRYYTSQGLDVFKKLPLTFHVTCENDESWKEFSDKYIELKKEGSCNVWILKPGQNSNRGRGITIHESYEQIKNIISSGQTFLDSSDGTIKKRTFIIQAYIEKPFLYNKRKFDIRSYMLLVNINKTVKGYWYREGYIRTSSFQFQLNDFNTFIHLTNDAIQNHSQTYGKYEDGNKVSYNQFQKYLDSKFGGQGFDFEKQIVTKMKQIATDAMNAAVNLVKGHKNQKPVFEIFGLDFMIDKNFHPWLIEINTNPCIETSCLVLQKVIPRMLDDAFKLSIDLLFPPPQNWPSSRKYCLPNSENKFQLVYEENKDDKSDQIQLPSLGVITEDGQVYEQKDNQ